MRVPAQREWHESSVLSFQCPMNEQTLAFVLKLRVLYQSTNEGGMPLLRGSLLHVESAQEQHFHSLERLVEILTHSLNTAARKSETEESKTRE